MKGNVESRIKSYEEKVSKFAARWHQLKPGENDLDGDRERCLEAVANIKERKKEFAELEELREAIKYVPICRIHLSNACGTM